MVGALRDLTAHTRVSHEALWWLVSTDDKRYLTFTLPKKAGGKRVIASPKPLLKRIQRWILKAILERLQTTRNCHGFAPGSKLRSHAEQHLGARAVLTLDIEDFFPSIPIARIVRVFRTAGYSPTGAWILSRLCTWRGVLPQGAPTSSRLANLVCYRMDRRLAQFASLRGFVYTRYADDLTFSSSSMGALAKARPFMTHIVRDSGFELNRRKLRLIGPRGSKVVTGLVLAPKSVGIGRRRLRELRARIHRAHVEGDNTDLSAIQGWLDYLSDVDISRYRMMVNYVSRLRAAAPGPLAQLRVRA